MKKLLSILILVLMSLIEITGCQTQRQAVKENKTGRLTKIFGGENIYAGQYLAIINQKELVAAPTLKKLGEKLQALRSKYPEIKKMKVEIFYPESYYRKRLLGNQE